MPYFALDPEGKNKAPGPGGPPGGNGPAGAPDLSEAATTLGIRVEELRDALGNPPDIETAAATLGISVAELEAVLPLPDKR